MGEIDVSKCQYLKNKKYCGAEMCIIGTPENQCNRFNDCYYKQLKRKEKECEELKKEIKRNLKQQEIKDEYLIPKVNKLKQTLQEIKERLIAVSSLEPQSTRILKLDIENIINEVKNEIYSG